MKLKHLSYIAFFVFILTGLAIYTSKNLNKEVLITGKTMGTTYHVKVATPFYKNTASFKSGIDKELEKINNSMSTYLNESEISLFNRHEKAGYPFPVSSDFYFVVKQAMEIFNITGGAWDGTVKPLMDLWGFTDKTKEPAVPNHEIILHVLNQIGFDKIMLSGDGDNDASLIKKQGNIKIDLASIAKGYGVDVIAGYLDNKKVGRYLVEIGGEVYAKGLRKDGKKWRVGINTPDKSAEFSDVYKAAAIENAALATSGDYRNYFEINGKTYSHIMDPRTGYPVTNGVVSATVYAPSCVLADGLATGLMVMGPEAAVSLVNELENVECLIITRNENNELTDYYSKNFKTLLVSE